MVKAPTPSLLDRYVVAIVRHRWLVVALATVLMLAVTAGLSRSLLIFASGDCAVILCDSLGGRLLLGFEITEG